MHHSLSFTRIFKILTTIDMPDLSCLPKKKYFFIGSEPGLCTILGPMATTAGAGGDVHRVLYHAVALCSASCAQRTTTNPTMKGAATPVTVGLDQAPQPHLTRLPIVSASASPTLSDHCTISWPPLTACSHLTRTYAATLGTGVFGARRNPH